MYQTQDSYQVLFDAKKIKELFLGPGNIDGYCIWFYLIFTQKVVDEIIRFIKNNYE